MTELLIRLFVKDGTNINETKVRAAYGRLSGVTGIICNLLLFAAKLVIGTLSGSVSITADAVNNLSDASSSIVTLLGFKLASKPADDKHPYGHSRIEYFAGLIVALFILAIGFELIKSSVGKIIHPSEVGFSYVLVTVLVISILVKLWLSLFNYKLGKRISSQTLLATAADSRNDVISTSAVLVACIVGKISGLMIDGYVGLLVALLIIWSGIGIMRDTIDTLLGKAPDEELVRAIANEIKSCEIVLGIHDLIVHDYGPGRRFASAHAEVDCTLDPLVSHDFIDIIEREVKEKLHVDLVIHCDPIVTNDEELNEMLSLVKNAVSTIDERFSVHDFRMVRGEDHTNLIFDLVIPYEYETKTEALKKQINDIVQFGSKKYYAVISFDPASFNNVKHH